MKRSIGVWELLGFGVVSLAGTLLHFLYEWTGNCVLVAPFSGVNESTWEHTKLLFWPMFVFAVVQWFFFRDRSDFWPVKLRGTLLGLALIPVLFYTYNGVIGKSPDWVNIAIFFVAAAAAYLFETKLFQKEETQHPAPWLAFAILCLVGGLYILFTFVTPPLGIFQDPVTGGYGLGT